MVFKQRTFPRTRFLSRGERFEAPLRNFLLIPCLLDVLLASIVLQRSLKLIDNVFRYYTHTHTQDSYL